MSEMTNDNINDNIYMSQNCGPYKIIEDYGYIDVPNDKRKRHYIKIEFLNTRNQKMIRADAIHHGFIHDDMAIIHIGKIFYHIYYGPYEIISYEGKKGTIQYVKIRFLNTGYEYIVSASKANIADVSDASVDRSQIKSSYGLIDYKEYDRQIQQILKNRWYGMMQRCYNPKDTRYKDYGLIGVTVCSIWQYVEGFLQTISSVANYNSFYTNPAHYQLDKDFLQRNIPKSQRVYSPLTCAFLSETDNSILSMIENKDSNSYFGIQNLKNGLYQVLITINGEVRDFGIYNNLCAAIYIYEHNYMIYSSYNMTNRSNCFPDLNLSNIYHRKLPKEYAGMNYDKAMQCRVK